MTLTRTSRRPTLFRRTRTLRLITRSKETQRILLNYVGLLHTAAIPALARHFADQSGGEPSNR